MNKNKFVKRDNINDLVELLGKISKQATDSLTGQIVLVELLAEKGLISKSEYKRKLIEQNDEIRQKILRSIE